MSPLIFAEGSHNSVRLPLAAEDSPSYAIAIKNHTHGTAGRMHAGDATCHHGWTLHAAEANRAGSVRKAVALMFVCNGSSFASQSEISERSMDDLAVWKRWWETGEFEYGDIIKTPLCPLVYPPSDDMQRAGKVPRLRTWTI